VGFHDSTVYGAPGEVEPTARLSCETLGLAVAFEQEGRIPRFELLGYDVALCIHEAEPGFSAEHPERIAGAAGVPVSSVSACARSPM
jgi:hypothetical protein